jgi:hypothetical protein
MSSTSFEEKGSDGNRSRINKKAASTSGEAQQKSLRIDK